MHPSDGGRTVFFLSSTLVTGGAERIVAALATKLPARGFRTVSLCLRERGPVGESIARAGIETRDRLASCRYDPLSPVRVAKRLRKDRHGILYALDHHDALLCGAAAGLLAGLRHRVMPLHSTGLWGRKGSLNLSDRLALPFYERVVALAGTHAAWIAEREGVDPRRIAVVNNGVDTGRFHPAEPGERNRTRRELGIDADAFVIVVVAKLRPEKNHAMLLDVVAGLRGLIPGLILLVAGSGKEEARLRARADAAGLGAAVRFLGLREDVPRILRASDVSVLPSHPVVETFPLSVLESMASGLPVVATRVGSIAEMVEDGEEGFLVDPGDEAGLRGAIARLADGDLRTVIGIRARERAVSRFSEERMIDEYARLFGRLVAGERSRR
ncbi:MAG: glycosyltransferase [Candidatus Krumholzibacteriota bacterium]|nr:glycosyltransferase [Candidatus Krumholzibacteriota bacterium]